MLGCIFTHQMCFSQNTDASVSSTFFIQCMVDFDSDEQTTNIENQLNTLPYVKMCRLDRKTKTAFIITKDIDVMNTDVVNSWFGQYNTLITCVYTGVYKVDKLQEFPLTICK